MKPARDGFLNIIILFILRISQFETSTLPRASPQAFDILNFKLIKVFHPPGHKR